MNRKALAAIQSIVTVALLALVFRGFDWPAFRALYAALPLWYFGASLAVILLGLVLYAWRWHILLQSTGTHVAFRIVLEQHLIGVFVNNLLPSTVGGDVAKVFYLGRGVGYRAVAASVVLDRLFGLGLLSALATVALWLEPLPHPRFLAARVALTAVTASLAALVALALVASGGWPQRLARFGGRAMAVATHVQQFREDLARAVKSPRVWAYSAVTVVSYFVLLTLVYQVFVVLHTDLHLRFVALLAAVASVAVLSNIPVAINGLGLREQLHVLMLEPLGVPKEAAVAISLLVFAHLIVASIAGGLLWWRALRHHPDRPVSACAPPAGDYSALPPDRRGSGTGTTEAPASQ